jgi:AraC family transcriptional regulator
MQQEPRIETIAEKLLVGKRISMSHADNRTAELWRSFMPQRNSIANRVDGNLISMQVYDDNFSFAQFNPNATFYKWAAAEVSSHDTIPDGMEAYTIPAGMYAVFTYKGNPINAGSFFQYIFAEWLPQSKYVLDARPHFEVLGDKYKNNDDGSEEEVWIPVRPK